MFATNFVQKLKSYMLCVLFNLKNTPFIFSFFFPEYGAVYEILWQSMVEPDRPQMTK